MIKLKDLLKELESRDNYYIANNIMEPRLAVRKYFNANKDSLEVLMDQDRWHEVYQIIFKQFPQFEQHILSTAINNEALDAGWLTKQVPVNAKLSLDSNSEVGEIQTTISAWVAKNKNKLIKLADDDDYTKFYQADQSFIHIVSPSCVINTFCFVLRFCCAGVAQRQLSFE